MTKFSPTKLHGDCEEVDNPSTAYGRRRRNWIDAHGSVPHGQVVDVSCGNEHCIALRHANLRPRVEQPGKYRKIAARVHRLKVGQHFDAGVRATVGPRVRVPTIRAGRRAAVAGGKRTSRERDGRS